MSKSKIIEEKREEGWTQFQTEIGDWLRQQKRFLYDSRSLCKSHVVSDLVSSKQQVDVFVSHKKENINWKKIRCPFEYSKQSNVNH